MLTIEHVNQLVRSMVANDVVTIEVSGNDYAIRLARFPELTKPANVKPALVQCLSPATGIFHARGEDDGLAALEPGAQVAAQETLGYIGIGSIRLLCVSQATGTLVGPLPPPGQTVDAGTSLFKVEPSK